MNSLRRIVRDLRLTAREAERSAGISGAQLFVLQSLAEAPASSVNDLAERTLTDQSSVSVVVRRLTDRKLVARKVSPEDGRRVELSVTAAGRRLLAQCPEPTQARLVERLRKMDPDKLAALMDGLGALVHALGIENEVPRMFFDDETPTPLSPVRRPARRDRAR